MVFRCEPQTPFQMWMRRKPPTWGATAEQRGAAADEVMRPSTEKMRVLHDTAAKAGMVSCKLGCCSVCCMSVLLHQIWDEDMADTYMAKTFMAVTCMADTYLRRRPGFVSHRIPACLNLENNLSLWSNLVVLNKDTPQAFCWSPCCLALAPGSFQSSVVCLSGAMHHAGCCGGGIYVSEAEQEERLPN
jgi:hypothetical protein